MPRLPGRPGGWQGRLTLLHLSPVTSPWRGCCVLTATAARDTWRMTSAEDEDARPAHAVTLGLLAVLQAEGVVSSAWSAELAGQAEAAWRRHAAAKGWVTRALKDDSAARIVEARRREGEAYRAADLIARACLAELGS